VIGPQTDLEVLASALDGKLLSPTPDRYRELHQALVEQIVIGHFLGAGVDELLETARKLTDTAMMLRLKPIDLNRALIAYGESLIAQAGSVADLG
jgi:hypothetical protein